MHRLGYENTTLLNKKWISVTRQREPLAAKLVRLDLRGFSVQDTGAVPTLG